MTVDDPTIELRPATPDDLNFAWSLYRQSMKPLTVELLEWNEAGQQAMVETALMSGEASIVLADRQEAGWVHIHETASEIKICQLFVLPIFQNRGIGTRLLNRFIAEARPKGKRLTLDVMTNNRARALYERVGFVQMEADRYKLAMRWSNRDLA